MIFIWAELCTNVQSFFCGRKSTTKTRGPRCQRDVFCVCTWTVKNQFQDLILYFPNKTLKLLCQFCLWPLPFPISNGANSQNFRIFSSISIVFLLLDLKNVSVKLNWLRSWTWRSYARIVHKHMNSEGYTLTPQTRTISWHGWRNEQCCWILTFDHKHKKSLKIS